ncbi:hypothetical protein EMIT051CA3_20214 [Pseudomonas chlororaphis]
MCVPGPLKSAGACALSKAGGRGPGSGRCSFNGNSEQREKHKVSDNQRYGIGLALLLIAGSVMAEDLPQQSILKRYGVTPDQLPAAAPATDKQVEPEPSSRFHIDAERPWASVTLGRVKSLKPPAISASIMRPPGNSSVASGCVESCRSGGNSDTFPAITACRGRIRHPGRPEGDQVRSGQSSWRTVATSAALMRIFLPAMSSNS